MTLWWLALALLPMFALVVLMGMGATRSKRAGR